MLPRRLLISAFVLGAVVTGVFWPTLSNEFFALDDAARITENPGIQRLSLDTVRWAFSEQAQQIYVQQPLTWLSFAVDWAIFGPDPAGFHGTNLALHVLTATLLLLLLWRLTGALAPSGVVAALFAVHPLVVEPVAWATERNTLLASALALIAMHAYVSYARGPTGWRYCGVLVAFLASLLAKPWLFGLPLVLLVLDFWPLHRWAAASNGRSASFSRLAAEKVPLLAVAAAWALAAARSMQHSPAALSAATGATSLGERVAYAPIAVVRYLAKIAVPVDLSVHYQAPALVPGWHVLGACAVVAGLTAAALACRRSAPSFLAGWLWFLALVAPTLGLVRAGSWPAIADRFAYLPLVGPLVALVFAAWTATAAPRVRFAGAVVAAGWIAVLAVSARHQLRLWRSSTSLLVHSIEVAPGSPLLEWSLGHIYAREGKLNEAEPLLRRSVPAIDTSEAHNELGNVLWMKGRVSEASEEYERAIARDPRNAEALYNSARALEARGRSTQARRRFHEFLRVAPPALDSVRSEVEKALGASDE